MGMNRKRWYGIFCVLFSCLIFASCGGSKEEQSDASSEYFSVETTQKEIAAPLVEDGRWQLLNSQFLQGEPVQIWYGKDEDSEGAGRMDVYLYGEDGSMELLAGGDFSGAARNLVSGRNRGYLHSVGTEAYPHG